MDNIKYMTLRDFLEGGFLQEANRHFFHPLGLALEARWDTDRSDFDTPVRLRVWDYRDDPLGMEFDPAMLATEEARQKRDNVARERLRHARNRREAFGTGNSIQAIPEYEDAD